MSYIRSSSNPEGLYICDSGDYISIIDSNEKPEYVSIKIWNGLFKKLAKERYYNMLSEFVEYKGLSIQNVQSPLPDGRRMILSYEPPILEHHNERNWSFEMWAVTFCFIETTVNRYSRNPAPWKVLTGVYYFQKLIRWLRYISDKK